MTAKEAHALQVLARINAAGGIQSEAGLREAYLAGVIDEELFEAGLDGVMRGIDSPKRPLMIRLPRGVVPTVS